MEAAMQRMKKGEARLAPILLKPCLWKESRFSELQLLPREAMPVTSWPSREEAFAAIAAEISKITKEPPASLRPAPAGASSPATDLSLVREQMIAYARLYERIRQQMPASDSRTRTLDGVFQRMKALVNAAFPLIAEFVASHSPGEKLAAVAILQCFAGSRYLEFLVELVRSEKPFVGYQAALALEFAVSATEPRCYPELQRAIDAAVIALENAEPGADSDRKAILARARLKLREAMGTAAVPAVLHGE